MAKRNYFGGYPIMTQLPASAAGLSKVAERLARKNFDFSGNTSAFGSTIPLIYGHALLSDPILIFASDQGDFLTTGWIVGEGVLATNSTNDTLSSNPLDAYYPSPNNNDEHIYVNGARRHDTRANFGIGAYQGGQDAFPPSGAGFFASAPIPDFSTNDLAMWGTAWVIIKTKKENNSVVDVNSGISGQFEIAFGRIVRVYSDATTFTRKSTTNPAWVLLDYETSKRSGGGYDFARFAKDTFKTVADYNDATVTSVIDGSSVPRWTFNGIIGDKKPFADYEKMICLEMMCTPPFVGSDGIMKVKSLKAETLSGLPFFSSKSGTASERNILWENGKSALTKTRKSILDIPNQLILNYMEWDGSAWVATAGVVEDQTVQAKLGTLYGANDGSLRVVSKSMDLIGTISRDEVARKGTLLLRVGEFAQGGLNNNCIITFPTAYKTSADIELADIIEVQDDLLDPTQGEQYFRVIDIKDDPQAVDGGGFVMVRTITATLHSNAFYDDSALTLTTARRIVGPPPNDKEAPPVTAADIDEQGIWDTNNKPMTELLFTYTEPSPLENFKDVVIMRSTLANPTVAYDENTNPANDDWRLITVLTASGDTVRNYEITNEHQVFTFLSRNLAGVTPSPLTRLPDDSAFKYPRVDILVDGIIDTLPAPGSFQIFTGAVVTLKWAPYTGNNLKLFKHYNVYRDTDSGFGSPDLIQTTDATMFVDGSVDNSTTYYYKVVGVSILNQEGTYTSALSTTSPAAGAGDAGTPSAPILGIVRSLAQLGNSRYEFTVGVDSSGGDTNWNTIYQTDIQISTDNTFATFPADQSLNESYSTLPPMSIEFATNYPGTYYVRARVVNSFGNGAWSSTLTRNTSMFDGVTADTDLLAAVTPTVTVRNGSNDTDIPGNGFDVEFEIPTTNAATYWGYSLFAHDSSTMPSNTTQETGTLGNVNPGVAILTDSSKSWTTNQWQDKDICIFSSKRGATPTFDGEGLLFLNKIISNTATTITFDAPPQSIRYKLTDVSYHIINRGATHHYFEKLKFTTPAIINDGTLVPGAEFSSRKRKIRVQLGFAAAHFWVALYNIHGLGKIPSAVSQTFNGITTPEIGSGQVASTNLASGAVIASKMSDQAKGWNTDIVFSASDNDTVAWTSGSLKTADGTTYSISSGNTGNMTALTFIYFDKTVSTTVLQTTTSYATVAGENVILVGTAKNTSGSGQNAFFVPAIGVFGINETNIGPNSISTGKIQAGAITANEIAANTITTGNLSATAIDGMTITGALIRTASGTGARIELDSTNGLRAYNASNVLRAQIAVSGGSAGDITFADMKSINTAFAITNSTGTREYAVSTLLGHEFKMGGTTVFTIDGSAATVSGGIVFSGSGSGLTSLNASNLSSGTVPSGRISGTYSNALTFSSTLTMSSANIEFTTGFGIVSSTTYVVVHQTNGVESAHGGTVVSRFSTGNGSQIYINSALRTLSIYSADLDGNGVKNYVIY